MKGTNINNLGKQEKNKNVKEGDCIFPFKYKKNVYSECAETTKGKICATSVTDRNTLKTYGYCIPKSSLKKLKVSSTRKTIKNSNRSNSNSKTNILKNKSTLKDMDVSNSRKKLNNIFLEKLSELNDIHTKKGEIFRARAYKKAEETILLQTQDIYDYSELKGLPNIGDTILSKFKEIQETGTLRLLEREKNNPLYIFTNVYGIGPKKAQSLIDKGIVTLDQLKEKSELLNDNQKIGLKYYDDINKRIPRDIIDRYKKIFMDVINDLNDENIKFDIVGSYRRGAKSSGDIDIIISHTHDNVCVFSNILSVLKEKNIIVEFLTKGKSKSLTITKIDEDNVARRVDFLYTPPNEYAFAVLYFTGSKAFNTVMRHRSLQLGFSLNEHGFSKMDGKKKGEKLTIMDFPTEESIFEFLQMKYKEPHERVDGRAVIPVDKDDKKDTPIKEVTINPVDKKDTPIKEVTINPVDKKDTPIKEVTINPVDKKDTPIKEVTINPIDEDNKISIKSIKKTKKRDPKKEIKSKIKTKKTKKGHRTFIDKFRDEGIEYLNKLTEAELIEIIKKANDAFFNDQSIISDSEYDIIKEYTERNYPNNTSLKDIGAPVVERNKVNLPYYMGSMDKIKPDTNAIDKWKEKYKGEYVVSAKLDGVSGMYSTENGVEKLYTRGNGRVGQDISYFIPYLRLPKDKNITIRGEFIINRNTFNEKYAEKFSNPRNFVSGIINSKSIDVEKFKDVEFIAYEVIVPELKPIEQMKLLDELNVTNVLYNVEKDVNNDMLSNILVDWRNNYKFESDGIIVTNNEVYDRVNKNPDHSFAFKMVLSEQIAEAKVVDVIWNVSKDGLLKPKIQIEPIVLGGATIKYATAHNASTVVNSKLGIGAIVKIIRSGDVIPYIMETVTPAEIIKMPDVEYKWNETNVDIELVNKSDNKDIIQKNITGFFTGIDVDGLSSGNVSRIINGGYNTVAKIVKMSVDDFLSIDGFKEKLANKIHDSIEEKLKKAELYKIMSSSNIFGHGFGERKMKLIMSEYSDIMISNESDDMKIKKLSNVKGMAIKTAQNFVVNIPLMIQFLDDTNLKYKLEQKKTINVPTYDTNHILYNKSIVFTGIREKELMHKLESMYSVKLSTSISKNTFAIIAKSKDEESSKLVKARNMNIPIFELDEFKEKYFEN